MEPLVQVYTWILKVLDIIAVLIKSVVLSLYALYQMFVPPEGKSVSGEIVLITGTGHGIGKELARQYGELGATVVCVDLNPASNEETVKQLKSNNVKAYAFQCDVSKREEVALLGSKVKSEVGDVSILVNNAGIMPCKRFLDHTPQDISKLFNVNVLAHVWMLQQFLPHMVEKNRGHVVGISSIAGLLGLPNVSPYCASKFAVRGLMESLSEELRSEGRSIGFTTIFPYMVDTGLCKKPRIKFPGLFPMQTPSVVASEIIMAQRRGYREHAVPGFIWGLHNLGRTLPEKTQMTLIDFVDSGVEASD